MVLIEYAKTLDLGMENIYFATCSISATTALVCALLLILRRREGNKARAVLIYIYTVLGIVYSLRTVSLLMGLEPFVGSTIYILLLGVFIITTYGCYTARVIFPRLFRGFRFLLLYAPFVLYTLIYLISSRIFGSNYDAFKPIETIADKNLWNNFSVIFRFILYANVVLLNLSILVLSFLYSKSRHVRIYAVVIQFLSIVFTLTFLFDHIVWIVSSVYQAGSVIIMMYITYIEIFSDSVVVKEAMIKDRSSANLLDISDSDEEELDESADKVQGLEPNRTQPADSGATSLGGNNTGKVVDSVKVVDSPLWLKLEEYMKTQEPWRNPQIKVADLSSALSTNRTSLAAEIHSHGYNRFYDYIVKYRIDAFCKIIEQNNNGNIKTAFFEVGFRSTSGAFKQFKLIHNMTPKQYLTSKPPEKTTKL